MNTDRENALQFVVVTNKRNKDRIVIRAASILSIIYSDGDRSTGPCLIETDLDDDIWAEESVKEIYRQLENIPRNLR